MAIELKGKLKLNTKTAAEWSSQNPILLQGELGHDSTNNRSKIGNGTSRWNDLSFVNSAVATTTANGLMSSADKTKLNGIATSANNYTHPANHPASIITQDASNRFVTDGEKTTWNGKASTAVVTTAANGLMSAADKTKLNGIATSANNYTHPANHPASIIIQDASNRFVTDTEKSTWNGKASTAVVTTAANGLMSAADKTKLNGIATGAQVNSVTSVAGRTGAVTLTKTDVGLGNVDNTSDASKPISTAMQTALNGKANTSHTHTIANISNLQSTLDGKQANLISGTNIKTINNQSLLGSGNIDISGGGTPSNMVTTNTVQSITANKTFTGEVFINNRLRFGDSTISNTSNYQMNINAEILSLWGNQVRLNFDDPMNFGLANIDDDRPYGHYYLQGRMMQHSPYRLVAEATLSSTRVHLFNLLQSLRWYSYEMVGEWDNAQYIIVPTGRMTINTAQTGTELFRSTARLFTSSQIYNWSWPSAINSTMPIRIDLMGNSGEWEISMFTMELKHNDTVFEYYMDDFGTHIPLLIIMIKCTKITIKKCTI